MRFWKYKIIVLIGALAAFLFTLWYSYDVYIDTAKKSDLPLILAPPLIVTKPSNPGGMIVPDKDKDIYNSMSGRINDSDNVRVMKDTGQDNVSRTEALAMIQKQIKRSSTQKATNVPSIQPSVHVFYIRVAKIKSPEVLENAIQILHEKYPVLAKVNGKLHEEKSILNTKYYVHLGPIKNSQAAEFLCDQLKRLNKPCAIFSEQH